MWIINLAITLFAFSSIEVFSKPLMGAVDPFFLTFFRFLIGGTFLMLIVFLKGERIHLKDAVSLTLVGSLNSIMSMTLLQLSVEHSSASTAATLIASNPIFVALIVSFKRGIGVKKIISILLGLFGIWLISVGKIKGDSTLGILFGIGASFTFALYTVLTKSFSDRYSPLASVAYSSFFSSIVYGAIILPFGKMQIPPLNFIQWMDVIYLGIVVTGVAYLTFFEAMKSVGTVNASMIFFLKPVVAASLAVLILGEKLTILKILGIAIVISSLLL